MTRKSLLNQFLSICKKKDYKAAIEFQDKIKDLFPGKPVRKKIRYICGLDISFDKGSDRVFAAEAKSMIYEYAGGIPRKINNAATACLMNATAKNLTVINEDLVNQTMSELHLR